MAKQNNNARTIYSGSLSEQIMLFMAEVGECSPSAIYLAFSNYSQKVISNNLFSLRKRGFLTILGTEKDKIKTCRIRKKEGLPFLNSFPPFVVNRYNSMTSNHSFASTSVNSKNISSTLRRHRIADTIAFMKNSGVLTGFNCSELSLTTQTDILDSQPPSFYTSIELKNIDKAQKHKIEFTRFVGCVFSSDTVFAIYNISDGVMKWSEQGEQKTRWFLQDILSHNSKKSSWKIASIVIYNNDDAILNSVDHENSRPEFLSFFNVYKNIYITPFDKNGIEMLKSFLPEGAQDTLKSLVFPKELLESSLKLRDCDCDIVDNNIRGFSFLSGNIARLKRLKSFIELPSSKNYTFQIFCYDFQFNFLSEYIQPSENIEFFPIEG